MASTRSRWPLWVGSGLILLFAALVILRAKAPPQAARLLPESDAMLFFNLRPLRTITHWDEPGNLLTPHRSRDLQHFVEATGIDPERDLDSAAFALHRMADPHGPNGPVAYSEVFIGRFDGDRLRSYLQSIARGKELYAGHEIVSIPVEGRTLRVAQLGFDTIAASNAPSPEQIHSMIDRGNAAALWRPGSSLLANRYHEVPLLALAWGIGRIGLPFGQDGHLSVVGFELPLSAETEFIASLRYSGALHLHVEEIAPDALAAEHTTEAVNGILSVLRGVVSEAQPQSARERAMRTLLSSLTTSQNLNRADLTGNVSLPEARALVAEDIQVSPSAAEPSADIMEQLPQRETNATGTTPTTSNPEATGASPRR